ncbi:MAG: hypothetical protein IPN90_09650 [Elusimicrobia bacterium]|nr:hypothetical protein [Elusimicrobiota bacterium]
MKFRDIFGNNVASCLGIDSKISVINTEEFMRKISGWGILAGLLGIFGSWGEVSGAELIKKGWGPDDYVTRVAQDGDTTYFAGNFQNYGPITGAGVPISKGTGMALGSFPKVDGSVYSVISDGVGVGTSEDISPKLAGC